MKGTDGDWKSEVLALLDRTRTDNFDGDERMTADRAVFIALPVKDGSLRLPTWFRRMTVEAEKIQPSSHVEMIILANGSSDDTADRVRSWAAELRGRVRVTAFEIAENIGKTRAVNALYAEARRRWQSALGQRPDLRFYIHFCDDDAYPIESDPSLVASNVRLLEDAGLARRLLDRPDLGDAGLRAVASTQISPTLRLHPSLDGIWSYLFARITHVRKGDYRRPIPQIYGQSYTVAIEHFPEDGVPADLAYEDCYLSTYFFPYLSTNPDAHHEHREPSDWTSFKTRYLRDLRHYEILVGRLATDGVLGPRHAEASFARARAHERLNEEIRQRHGVISVERALLRVNWLLKKALELRSGGRLH